jgi:hypothetical protein
MKLTRREICSSGSQGDYRGRDVLRISHHTWARLPDCQLPARLDLFRRMPSLVISQPMAPPARVADPRMASSPPASRPPVPMKLIRYTTENALPTSRHAAMQSTPATTGGTATHPRMIWTLCWSLAPPGERGAQRLRLNRPSACAPSSRLARMQEAGEGVFRAIDAAGGQHHTHVAPMVCTVRKDMEQHLLAGHGAAVAVSEGERK